MGSYFVFLRNVVEKGFKVNSNLYIASLDLMDGFENVNWNVMMEILKMIEIVYRDRRIVRDLYKRQLISIKIN
jgi:hypothetical protein